MDWLRIEGNVVEVDLVATDTRGRHGIYVGNCRSLQMQENRVTVTRAAGFGARPVQGIILQGHMDRHLVVRHNHVSGATVGVSFEPLGTVAGRPNWTITENTAVAAATAVVVTPAQMRGLVRGISDNFA